MLKVGLTGGIGSGKTLVCCVLEKLGVPVYYADLEARRLMNSNTELKTGILRLFGEEAYSEEGLNRAHLAKSVFGDEKQLSRLNALVHPAVRDDFNNWAESQSRSFYVVEEAAILFESGASREMDLSVLVFAPEEIRIRRVMERDASTRKVVLERMKHQISEEEKKKLADFIITNDGTVMLLPQVIELHKRILKRRK
jgi:dephospho-CoA kinase